MTGATKKKVAPQEHGDNGNKGTSILHAGFEIAILLKGIHAVLEIVGGILLALVKPSTLDTWIRLLTQNELAEDPTDLIANLVVRAGRRFTTDTQQFGVFYLLTHGLVKVVLVLLLWRRKIWAYPLAAGVLFLFIAYQVFRWTTTHSAFLLALSVLDALLVWLTLMEYARLQKGHVQAGELLRRKNSRSD